MTTLATKEKIIARPQSQLCYDQLCKVIPGGVNSPVRAFKGLGVSPLIVQRGLGDTIWDIDGHSYIDYCGSWGQLIHGHAHPKILDAIVKRAALGSTFGITTEAEKHLANKIIQHVPSIEKIRFVSSGTEATMTAARLARGFTNRDLIVKFIGNYHGHADFFLIQAGSGVFGINATSSSAGIPAEIVSSTACLPYNDLEQCRHFLLHPENRERIAAIIIEPIAGNMGCVPAKPEFLSLLRTIATEIGAVLIFDEVISGFRVGLGGAQALYGIQPDLTCFGKIIGGGLPAAAFGGKAQIMDLLAPLGPVYQAGTLSGNPIAMEAGVAAIELLEKESIYQELEEKTHIITQPVTELLTKKQINACVQQIGSMFTLFFGQTAVHNMEDAKALDFNAFAHFFREMLSQGIYVPPAQQEAWFVSTVHQKAHLEKTRDAILDFLKTHY